MTRAERIEAALLQFESDVRDNERGTEPPITDMMVAVSRNALRFALAPESGGREPSLVTCGMYRHGAALGLRHVAQADCFNPKPAPSSQAAEQPDPKALEVTERDRWAWRLGWAAAMSERAGRTFNPSDAPEPPSPVSPAAAPSQEPTT